MRILYVVHQFFPKWYTGTERFVLNTAKQMQRMGHHVEVLTYGFEDNDGFLFQDGGMYKNYQFQGVPVIAVRHRKVPNDILLNIFSEEIEPLLRKIITKERYDVVHMAHLLRLGSAGRVAASAGLPVILTLTDFWLMCPRGIAITPGGELCQSSEAGAKCIKNCFGVAYKDKIVSRCAAIDELIKSAGCMITATNFLKQILERNYPQIRLKLIRFGEDYINVMPNTRTYSNGSDITLGFLSTLQPHKGAHVLLRAFKLANKNNLNLKIYGHYFCEMDYYKKLSDEYNEKVEFCGEYKYEDMPGILNTVDIVVVPSLWWENSPLVILTALAHNVPVIVSNLGGLTEIIKDGENGFSFEAGNAESLRKVLEKISEDPGILNDIKDKIRHPPRIEEEAFEYEKIYVQLLDQRGQSLRERN